MSSGKGWSVSLGIQTCQDSFLTVEGSRNLGKHFFVSSHVSRAAIFLTGSIDST